MQRYNITYQYARP